MSMSPTATAPVNLGRLNAGGTAGPLLFAANLLVAAYVFWPGLVSLVDAWGVPEYSHGPLIPFISLFLFLREMRDVPPVDRAIHDRWPGVLVAVTGLVVGMLGGAVRIDDIVTYGMIMWMAGVVLICFGFRRGVLFWPAILHLIFMLPLPQFIYWQVSVYLQTISSQIGVALIQFANIPVYLDGNIIDLGVYKLQVAEACSGLRYLFPMLSFSYVFAVLYQGPKWHKAVLLLSAAPITVAMNSFRIGMIGVLVNSYGIEHAEGFLHAFEGWIIFLSCVVILFGIAMALQRLTRNPKPLSETLDIEFTGLNAELRRFRSIAPSLALAALLAITATAATAIALWPEREPVAVEREPLALFPRSFEGWTGSPQYLEPEIENVLGADDYLSANFSNSAERASVDLFVAWYDKQTEGSGIHSPEVCIPTSGWEVSAWRRTTVALPSGAEINVNRAIIQKGVHRQLVYYWFAQRGRTMTSDYAVKLVTVMDALTIGRTDGGLVRLITPVAPNEDEADADARMSRFLADTAGIMPRFLPD
jgi:exosortase D (VPLPA-CTERM-specific)